MCCSYEGKLEQKDEYIEELEDKVRQLEAQLKGYYFSDYVKLKQKFTTLESLFLRHFELLFVLASFTFFLSSL